MTPHRTTALLGTALIGGVGTLIGLMATGKLTLDTGWGRTTHALGPQTWTIDAPRDMVWQQFTSPYLGAIPRSMSDSLSVIERGSDMVIARIYRIWAGTRPRPLRLSASASPRRSDSGISADPYPTPSRSSVWMRSTTTRLASPTKARSVSIGGSPAAWPLDSESDHRWSS